MKASRQALRSTALGLHRRETFGAVTRLPCSWQIRCSAATQASLPNLTRLIGSLLEDQFVKQRARFFKVLTFRSKDQLNPKNYATGDRRNAAFLFPIRATRCKVQLSVLDSGTLYGESKGDDGLQPSQRASIGSPVYIHRVNRHRQ